LTATEEQIREVADGQTSHRYAALSLSFKMVVEKRRNVNTPESLEDDLSTKATLEYPSPGGKKKKKKGRR